MSDDSQNEFLQHVAASLHIKDFPSEKVIRLSDHGVSAMKIEWRQRPGLRKAMQLFEEGYADTLVAYARDRVSRDPYEWPELLEMLKKLNVNVIFTRTGEPPVQDNILMEAFYAFGAYNEGKRIGDRTRDAHRLTPPKLYGYDRIREGNSLEYKIQEGMAKRLSNFFGAVLTCTDFSQLEDTLKFYQRDWKVPIPRLLRLLHNPLYAGCREDDGKLATLDYIAPVVSTDIFLEVRDKLQVLTESLQQKLAEISLIPLKPICAECGRPMNTQESLSGPQWFCKSGHRRVSVPVVELNQNVERELAYATEHIDPMKLRSIVIAMTRHHLRDIEGKVSKLNHRLDELSEQMHFAQPAVPIHTLRAQFEETERQLHEAERSLIQLRRHEQDVQKYLATREEFLTRRLLLPQHYRIILENLLSGVYVGRGYIRLDIFYYDFIKWGAHDFVRN